MTRSETPASAARSRAVAAADVRDRPAGLQPLDDAVERRQPLRHQVRAVADGEHALDAVEEPVVVLVPAEALARDEALRDALARQDRRVGALEGADHLERAGGIGEHEGVLGRQDVAALAVLQEAAGRLGGEPLAHVALLGAGAGGQLLGGDRLPVGHGAVEAELLADQSERRVDRGADLRGDVPDEGLELGLVDVRDGHQITQRSWYLRQAPSHHLTAAS